MWLAVNGPPPGPATVVYPPETQQSTRPVLHRLRAAGGSRRTCPAGDDQIFQGGLQHRDHARPRRRRPPPGSRSPTFLDGTEPDLRTSLVAVEPPTGYVRAFVSGRDFATDNVNYALGKTSAGGVGGGGSGRQPGSAFKPFVLAAGPRRRASPPTPRYSGRPHDVSEACHSPGTVARQLRREPATAPSTCARPPGSRSTPCTPASSSTSGVDKVMALAKQMGLTERARLRPGRSTAPASPSAPSRCRPSTWPPPTACSRLGACGPSPPRCCGSPTATATSSSTTPSRRRPGCSRRTWPTTSPTSSRAC